MRARVPPAGWEAGARSQVSATAARAELASLRPRPATMLQPSLQTLTPHCCPAISPNLTAGSQPFTARPCNEICSRVDCTLLCRCNNTPDYMTAFCPFTCGTCETHCCDLSKSCASWAAQGKCASEPGSMLSVCPWSCGKSCARPPSPDKDQACRFYASDGEVRAAEDALAGCCTVQPLSRGCLVLLWSLPAAGWMRINGAWKRQPTDAGCTWATGTQCSNTVEWMSANCPNACACALGE